MNLLQTAWLANCCESYLVEFPLLYVAFSKMILAEFQDYQSSPSFLSSKPSFLDDYIIQHSDFSSFLAVFFLPISR